MKRSKILLICLALVAVALTVTLIACNNNQEPTPTPSPTPYDPFDDPAITYDAVQWVKGELYFTSDKEYAKPVYEVQMDCIFTNTTTGTTYTVPAFWDGGTNWTVRYALTEKGDWTWKTTCTDTENAGLTGKEGTLKCGAYKGDLDIYKHGFIKTETGSHYFMYADGTPFFYLADTHWTLPLEDYDSYGDIPEEVATANNIKSMFKFIMDYRVDQGFTVIQSQPLGYYNGTAGNSWLGDAGGSIFTYGVTNKILAQFQTLDKYYEYIAEKGLVHSQTQFAYPEELIELKKSVKDDKLDALCRYWVARYSAYPIMWATTQEGDNDYFQYAGCTPETNRWKTVFEYIQKYDPYDHPATCHQEHVSHTRVENSAFGTLAGHTWYAAQYSCETSSGHNQTFSYFKEYWNNEGSKPVVNYEGHYDHYWGGPLCTRTQGWCAYLNGMFGFGYGVQPIWSLSWGPGDSAPATYHGETYNRDQNWFEGLTNGGGFSMSYMKKFFENYEWWKLTPCFDGNEYYTPTVGEITATNYSVATIGNDLYIGYFYNTVLNENSQGQFTGMKTGKYEVKWFNTVDGTYTEATTVDITDGTYIVPLRPDSNDWVIVAKYCG